MCSKWQLKVTSIKESNNLNNFDITNLFRKLIEYEKELKWLATSEVNSKKKNKFKEKKWDISLKASSSKKNKVEDDSEKYEEDSSKEEEMRSFIKCYNKYMKTYKLKHSDKKLINLKKSHPHKKENKGNEEDITCFKCIKLSNQ